MLEGTVKFFNRHRGFGFITAKDDEEYYVNSSGIKYGNWLNEGDRVSFEVVGVEKGSRAEQVEIIESA